jgi:hypothetical protein
VRIAVRRDDHRVAPPQHVVRGQLVTGIALAQLAVGCVCGPEQSALEPVPRAPVAAPAHDTVPVPAAPIDDAVDEPAQERAAPAPPGPVTPVPRPNAPIACADLDPSIAVFAGTRRGDTLVLTERISGPEDDAPFPRTFVLDAADLDDDGTEEGLVVSTSEVGTRGERERDCGNYGECRQGAALRCDVGWAMVLAPEYRFELSVGTTHTRDTRAFRVLVEATRLAEDQADEVERMDDGRPLFSTTALVMGPHGYAPAGNAAWYESGECARLYREGLLADARDMCEQGLIAHPRGRVRAALLYDLGRVLEAQGHAEQARDAYVRSLALRENETVRAHLEALPAP